jgi:hypothetical protein
VFGGGGGGDSGGGGGSGGGDRRLLEESYLKSRTRQLILCLYFLTALTLFLWLIKPVRNLTSKIRRKLKSVIYKKKFWCACQTFGRKLLVRKKRKKIPRVRIGLHCRGIRGGGRI